MRLIATIALLISVMCASAAEQRFQTVLVSRETLNKPIAPFDLYVQVETMGDDRERFIKVIVLHGEPVKTFANGLQDQLRRQIRPHLYRWHKEGSTWLAGFLRNRDGSYHTIVSMSKTDIEKSTLSLLIEDVNGDGKREDITVKIDLSTLDWSASRSWIIQGKTE